MLTEEKCHPFNPLDEFKDGYRVIAGDLRTANGGQSTGPPEINRPWEPSGKVSLK